MQVTWPYQPRYSPRWPLTVFGLGLVLMAVSGIVAITLALLDTSAYRYGIAVALFVFMSSISVMMVVLATALIAENQKRHLLGEQTVAIKRGRWEADGYRFNQGMNLCWFALGLYCGYLALNLAQKLAA